MFQAIWNLLMAGGSREIRSLRLDFIYILGSVLLIPIVQLLTNGWGNITAIYAMLCIVMIAWRLVNIRRILSLTGVGELAELFRLVEEQTGFPPNKIIGWYIGFGKGLLFFACAYFLTIPLIDFREWLPALVFVPFLFALGAAILGVQGGPLFRFMAGVAIIFWVVLTLNNLFPQVSYYTGWESIRGKIASAKLARLVNETDKLRIEQRDRMIEDAQQKILDWQKANPGKELPAGHDLLLNLEAAKKGLSFDEYRDELKKVAEAQTKADAEAKAAADAKAKADALEKIRLEAERQEAEKKSKELAAEKDRRSILTLLPTGEGGREDQVFNLPPETKYGNRFKFLEAVPLIGRGGGSIFVGNQSVGNFPSVIPSGFTFVVPREAVIKNGSFKLLISSLNAKNIDEIKIKRGGD